MSSGVSSIVSDIPHQIWTIDVLCSDAQLAECNAFIDRPETSARPFSSTSGFRNGKYYDPDMAGRMYEKIAPHLPEVYTDGHGVSWTFSGAVDHVFFSEVLPGQQFCIHTDTGAYYDRASRRQSKFTALTYLNDDYQGGTTEFLDDGCQTTHVIVPIKNRTLLFDIDLFHKGNLVISGTKRWIGTELICQPL